MATIDDIIDLSQFKDLIQTGGQCIPREMIVAMCLNGDCRDQIAAQQQNQIDALIAGGGAGGGGIPDDAELVSTLDNAGTGLFQVGTITAAQMANYDACIAQVTGTTQICAQINSTDAGSSVITGQRQIVLFCPDPAGGNTVVGSVIATGTGTVTYPGGTFNQIRCIDVPFSFTGVLPDITADCVYSIAGNPATGTVVGEGNNVFQPLFGATDVVIETHCL